MWPLVRDIPLDSTPKGRTPINDGKRKVSPGISPLFTGTHRKVRLNASSSGEDGSRSETKEEDQSEIRKQYKKVMRKSGKIGKSKKTA